MVGKAETREVVKANTINETGAKAWCVAMNNGTTSRSTSIKVEVGEQPQERPGQRQLQPGASNHAEQAARARPVWSSLSGLIATPQNESPCAARGLPAAPTDRSSGALAAADRPEDGTAVTDLSGVIRQLDDHAAALLGGRDKVLVGKPLPFLLPEAEWRLVYGVMVRLRLRQSRFEELSSLRLRGERGAPPVFVSARVSVLPSVQGEVLCWAFRNVTRHRVTERALQAEKAFTDSLMDAAQAVVLVVDRTGVVLRCNPYTLSLTGLTCEEMLGREWALLLPAEDRQCGREAVWRGMLSRDARSFRAALVTRARGRRAVAWSVKALPPDSTPSPWLLVVGHDITDLEAAQRQAVQSERLAAVGQMMTVVAHESRGLLQTGQSSLERLSWRVEGQPEALRLVSDAQESLHGLTRLYDDLRAYAGPLVLECAPCHLPDLWREVWAEVQADWPEKQPELVEVAEDLDLWCFADRFRLSQVFRNLMENSLAACASAARVEIVCRQAELGGKPAICVSVRDNGPGLPPEVQTRLFEPFFTTKSKGTGLGMTVAKRTVEAHGGEITIGRQGPGAEFVLTLPRSKP